MNPANDSGKKALPPNLAEKFTTIIMSEPNRTDIEMMSKELCPQLNPCEIAELYFELKKTKTISLRNLSRALAYINHNKDTYGWSRSVYDGLMLGFGQKDLLRKYLNESAPKPTPNSILLEGFLL
jgi:midasin (ATPase involved in ribosome maturation)